jgi:hypothetical protein
MEPKSIAARLRFKYRASTGSFRNPNELELFARAAFAHPAKEVGGYDQLLADGAQRIVVVGTCTEKPCRKSTGPGT